MTVERTPRTLVIMPTFNEIENLQPVLERLFTAVPSAHVLVVDDGSPDGTGVAAEQMAAADDRISVVHRDGKLGLGSAYILGFGWGVQRGYELLVEMDADGSHPPETLPQMIATAMGADVAGSSAADMNADARDADLNADAGVARGDVARPRTAPGLVIGSRWVPGGRVLNWPRHRNWLSRAANTYARLALGIRIRDSTAGFRVFRADVLRDIRLDEVDSKGYCFQVDMTLRVLDAGYEIVEVPIEFLEREHGESKMSQGIVMEAMRRVTVWALQRRLARVVHRATDRVPGGETCSRSGISRGR